MTTMLRDQALRYLAVNLTDWPVHISDGPAIAGWVWEYRSQHEPYLTNVSLQYPVPHIFQHDWLNAKAAMKTYEETPIKAQPELTQRQRGFVGGFVCAGGSVDKAQDQAARYETLLTEHERTERNKYQREIAPGVWVDVYDVLLAFDVRNPALQHLIKKALCAGLRGHKTTETDLQDIIDSALRAKELHRG